MTSPALTRLAETLDADEAELSELSALDDAALERLRDLVAGAIVREEAAVDDALQATLRFLPRPLRGRAKKMLFPEDS